MDEAVSDRTPAQCRYMNAIYKRGSYLRLRKLYSHAGDPLPSQRKATPQFSRNSLHHADWPSHLQITRSYILKADITSLAYRIFPTTHQNTHRSHWLNESNEPDLILTWQCFINPHSQIHKNEHNAITALPGSVHNASTMTSHKILTAYLTYQ